MAEVFILLGILLGAFWGVVISITVCLKLELVDHATLRKSMLEILLQNDSVTAIMVPLTLCSAIFGWVVTWNFAYGQIGGLAGLIVTGVAIPIGYFSVLLWLRACALCCKHIVRPALRKAVLLSLIATNWIIGKPNNQGSK